MTLVPVRRLLLCLVFATGSVACGKKETPPEESAESVEKTEGELSPEPDASEPAEDAAAKDGDAVDGTKRKNARDRLNGRRPPPRGRDKLGEPSDGDAVDGEPAGTDKDPQDAKGPADPADPTKAIDAEADPADPTKVADPKLPPDVKRDVKSDPSLPSDAKAELPPEVHKSAPQAPIGAQPLDAHRAMPLQAVIDATQAKGLSDAGTLPGIATGPGYVSILYKGPAADKFGIALQAWQDPARREADDRFRRMRLQYPNAEDVQVLQPAKAFFAHFGGIQMLTFVDSVKRIVATVSCGEDLCSHDQLTKLARSVREKL